MDIFISVLLIAVAVLMGLLYRDVTRLRRKVKAMELFHCRPSDGRAGSDTEKCPQVVRIDTWLECFARRLDAVDKFQINFGNHALKNSKSINRLIETDIKNIEGDTKALEEVSLLRRNLNESRASLREWLSEIFTDTHWTCAICKKVEHADKKHVMLEYNTKVHRSCLNEKKLKANDA